MAMRDGILLKGGRFVRRKIKDGVIRVGCYGVGVGLVGLVLLAPYIIDEA